MPSTVYLETSIVQLTRKWWNMQRSNFELFVSSLVLQEAAVGNPTEEWDMNRR